MQGETRYARSGDVAIAYRVLGDGPFDVVYHPGFISHVELMTEMPTYQGRIIDGLGSFSRVIVFDQRGVGMSDRTSGAPGLETRMDDIRAVMGAAGVSRAAIVSASIGVPTTLLFAATYPERTSALVLARGFARHLWAPDYPWGWTLERQHSLVAAYQLLYFGSHRDAAEREPEVRKGHVDRKLCCGHLDSAQIHARRDEADEHSLVDECLQEQDAQQERRGGPRRLEQADRDREQPIGEQREPVKEL